MNVPIVGYFEIYDGNFHKNTQKTNLIGLLNICTLEPEVTDALRDKAPRLCSYRALLKSFRVHIK